MDDLSILQNSIQREGFLRRIIDEKAQRLEKSPKRDFCFDSLSFMNRDLCAEKKREQLEDSVKAI